MIALCEGYSILYPGDFPLSVPSENKKEERNNSFVVSVAVLTKSSCCIYTVLSGSSPLAAAPGRPNCSVKSLPLHLLPIVPFYF